MSHVGPWYPNHAQAAGWDGFGVDRRPDDLLAMTTNFMGTHAAKFDAKGRVLIPAPFRAALRNENGGASLIARPSDKHQCIECWPEAGFEVLAREIQPLSPLSDDHEDWAASIFAEATLLESDREGRIVLPATLTSYSDITDAMVFMGLGKNFQIWEPGAAERRKSAARERVGELRKTLGRAA